MTFSYFDRVFINDKYKMIVRNGKLRTYQSGVIFSMGTPLSDKELEPIDCIDMNWDNMIMTEVIKVLEPFKFNITTRDGRKFEGNAMISAGIWKHGKFIGSDYCSPVIIDYKEEKKEG